MAVYVRALFNVRDEQESEFAQSASALKESAAGEPGTLSFGWFSSHDPETFIALEGYADSAAFMAHSEHSAELLQRLSGSAEMISLELYGDVDAGLRAWASTLPIAVVHPHAVFGV